MKLIFTLALLTLMTGCTSLSKPVVIESRVGDIPIFHPPMPDRIKWNDFKWTVWTHKEMRKYLKMLDEGKAPEIAIYWITPDGYKVLSGNMSEIIRMLKVNKSQLLYYRNLGKKNRP